jgi:hypothetical protein
MSPVEEDDDDKVSGRGSVSSASSFPEGANFSNKTLAVKGGHCMGAAEGSEVAADIVIVVVFVV